MNQYRILKNKFILETQYNQVTPEVVRYYLAFIRDQMVAKASDFFTPEVLTKYELLPDDAAMVIDGPDFDA